MFDGLLPALVLPFHADGTIDDASFVRLTEHVARRPGVSALVVNGHAGEGTSLTREERRHVIERVVHTVGGALPVVAGIAVETAAEAVDHARDAASAGASALLVLPPHIWLISRESAAPRAFFGRINDAVDLPMIAFQYPQKWGAARYDHATLLELTAIPNVRAVKDASWEVSAYEEDYRLLKRERPEIAVLCANDEHILSSFVIGADGALLGFGSVAADLIVEILAATRANDLARARAADERLYPLTKAFYKTQPTARMHTRIKHALKLQGLIDNDYPRDPLLPLDADERARVRSAMEAAGLL